jgi:hypothetical protein
MSEDVKVSRREINGFIDSKCFMAQGTVKICQVLQGGKDSVMQNCSVKKWMPFLHYTLKTEAVKK